MHGRLSPAAVRLSLIRVSSLLAEFPISPRMGRARRLAGSRRVRIGVNAVFITGALAAAALTILHFVHSGWPLANADPLLVIAAGILFLFAYAFKAWGWQRLFPEGERPEALTLAAAGGAASVGGVALPGRFDEAIRVAVVRRGPGKPPAGLDRKSTRLNSSHTVISYAVFCLKKKNTRCSAGQ